MAERPIWVLKSRRAGTGRRHMALFVPRAEHVNTDPNDKTRACMGTKIHVTGALMAGFCHEYQRNYDCRDNNLESATKLGIIDPKYINDPEHTSFLTDQKALGKGLLDDLASRVPVPPLTKDYLNPANAHNIRDCQDWIRDFVKYLFKRAILDSTAEEIVDGLIDPQAGIGLRPVPSNETKQ